MSDVSAATAYLSTLDSNPDRIGGIIVGFQLGLSLALQMPDWCWLRRDLLTQPELSGQTNEMWPRLMDSVEAAAMRMDRLSAVAE